MTEYMIKKDGKDLKPIKCTEEYAASIAMQIGGEYEEIVRRKPPQDMPKRTSRKEQIINEITREAAEVRR